MARQALAELEEPAADKPVNMEDDVPATTRMDRLAEELPWLLIQLGATQDLVEVMTQWRFFQQVQQEMKANESMELLKIDSFLTQQGFSRQQLFAAFVARLQPVLPDGALVVARLRSVHRAALIAVG
jgi:hypothetical protein